MSIQYKERVGGALGHLIRGEERGTPCSSPHPNNPPVPDTADEQSPSDNWHWCRKIKGHLGPHSAFTFSISEPEEWE